MASEEIIQEIRTMIDSRRKLQRLYKRTYISIQITIASSGFLIAAASQKNFIPLFINLNWLLLILGLLSAVCVIVDQIIKPSQKYLENKNIKRALQGLCNRAMYDKDNWPDSTTSKYLLVCQTNPLLVIGKLEDLPY